MGIISNPFKARQQQQGNNTQQAAAPNTNTGGPTTGPLVVDVTANGGIKLVSLDPEVALNRTSKRLEGIQFGWSGATKWMEGYSEVWAWLGPIILVIGTIVEVGLVLYERQRVKDFWSLLSIIAVAMVLEGTFLTVSYKAALIRNRGEKRPEGPTDLDKKKMKRLVPFWFALAVGVCATQVIFIVAQTLSFIPGQGGDIGTTGVWVFAILRAVFTCVADGYTAFAHEEKPTTAEQEEEAQAQRTQAEKKFLQQENERIAIINDGTLQVRQTAVEAQIKDDKLTTRLETERMQNRGQIKAIEMQYHTAEVTSNMLLRLQSALFDPATSAEERQVAINLVTAIGKGYSALDKNRTRINQIESEDM